jgi:hypothetical protein
MQIACRKIKGQGLDCFGNKKSSTPAKKNMQLALSFISFTPSLVRRNFDSPNCPNNAIMSGNFDLQKRAERLDFKIIQKPENMQPPLPLPQGRLGDKKKCGLNGGVSLGQGELWTKEGVGVKA